MGGTIFKRKIYNQEIQHGEISVTRMPIILDLIFFRNGQPIRAIVTPQEDALDLDVIVLLKP